MAYWLMILLGKLLTSFLLVSNFLQQHFANGEPQVPCLFIFGDSLSDNGNNNDRATLAKANYQPYGIDFPKGTTGRFTNGRNLPDFIAEKLGFPHDSIPSYANAAVGSVKKILKGVNYASGGSGILTESVKTMTLHKREARKVVVFGLGLLGCIPYEVRINGANISGCVDKFNEAVILFNSRLKSLVSYLNNNLTKATFIFINSTGISLDSNIPVSNAACCQVSELVSAPQCIPLPFGKVCSNRTQYAFWDELHPSETAFSAIAARAYRALLPTDSYPFDIQRLAQL
ncbi:GDSL esterase/lipase At2g19010-like isoform X2 [Juglans regia]|uniref:GDSL esterase/lipase At2g19010-like isoform X2 n=1 Tax=Juglans regia TaxID=51240 RepID=A0A6P9F4G4_JUGRE|nr:GDSL esterase/lipase At2g19010-like isoform X2 [Juglans regia]